MSVFVKNFFETVIVPETSKEVFLPLQSSYARALSDSDVTNSGFTNARKGFNVRREAHNCHVLLFCTDGAGAIKTKEGAHDLKPGMVLLNPAGVYVEYRPKRNDWSFFWFHLKDSFKWRDLKNEKNSIRQSHYANELRNSMFHLISESTSMEKNHDILAGLHAKLILYYLERELDADVDKTRLSHVWDTVNTDLSKRWTLKELAEISGMSYDFFAHRCKTTYGVPPMKFLTKLRVERSKEMILTSNYKLEAIAQASGYNDASTFSTVFKKHTGLSPRAYRLRNQPRVQSPPSVPGSSP